MITKIFLKNYDDITEIWTKEKYNEIGFVKKQNYLYDKNNIKHIFNNKTVKFNHSNYEIKIAKWFAKIKRINVKLLPEITYPQNIKSGDFIEVSTNNVWEIKEPTGNTIGTTLANQFKKQKEKAKKFIIDLHFSSMTDNTAINELYKILSSKRYMWIEEVVLIRNLKIIKIYKLKK